MYRKFYTIKLIDGTEYHLRAGFTHRRVDGSSEGMYKVVQDVTTGTHWITIKYNEESNLRIPVHQIASIQTNIMEADLI